MQQGKFFHNKNIFLFFSGISMQKSGRNLSDLSLPKNYKISAEDAEQNSETPGFAILSIR